MSQSIDRCITKGSGVTLVSMPTTRPRHIVTETDAVARALDAAARVWPEDASRRSRLLVRLVEAGHRVVNEQVEDAVKKRLAVIDAVAGSLAGVYGPNYREQLREEWPA